MRAHRARPSSRIPYAGLPRAAPCARPRRGIVRRMVRRMVSCPRTVRSSSVAVHSSDEDYARRHAKLLAHKRGASMTNIHLIGGEKGGVGKSLVARLLAQYMIDNNISFLGFDSDRSHGALLRFYAGYASPVLIDSYDSMDAIVEAAAEAPERRVLVDLAAQTQERLTQWMDDSQLLEVAPELGLHIRYWHVMAP